MFEKNIFIIIIIRIYITNNIYYLNSKKNRRVSIFFFNFDIENFSIIIIISIKIKAYEINKPI